MPLSVRPFQAEQVAKPTSLVGFVLPRAFSDKAPIDLEIGCGVGWHPISYAKANPDRRLIAIEHTKEKFESFLGRFEKNGEPDNLLPVHADAVRWITHALAEESISKIFLLYPNPEPKAPNKRWFRAPFFERLLWCLEPGGTITLATNIESYMTEAREFAAQVWQLELKQSRVINTPTASARTHFEKKYLDRGETCYDAVFVKRKSK